MRIITRLGAAALSTALLIDRPAGVARSAGTPTGHVDVHGSSTVAPISLAVAEDFASANPDWAYAVGRGRHGRRLHASSSASTTATSRMPRGRSARTRSPCAAENGVDVRRAQDRLRRPRGHHVAPEPDRVPEPVRPVRALRPRVERHHDVAGRRGVRPRAGLDDRLPDGDIASPRRATSPARTTRSSSWPLARRRRGARRRPRRRATPCPRRTSAPPTTTSSSRASRSSRPRIGFVGLAYAEQKPARPSRSSRVDGGEGCVAAEPRDRRRRHLPLSRPLFIYPGAEPAREQPGDRPLGRLLPLRRGHRQRRPRSATSQLPAEELAGDPRPRGAPRPAGDPQRLDPPPPGRRGPDPRPGVRSSGRSFGRTPPDGERRQR